MIASLKLPDIRFSRKGDTGLHNIDINKIRPNPYQPRKYFDRASLGELADSIKRYGVLQPISVRINGSGYELVAGERRLRAAKIAGLETIPAIVVDISDKTSASLTLIENLQRQNLSFIEEAEGYQSLIKDYGFTQDELASRMGKNQSTIANKLRILKLNSEALKMIVDNDLTERHARAVVKLPEPQMQIETLKKVIELGLNIKKTEELVEKELDIILNGEKEKPTQKIKRGLNDIRLFTNTIKQSIELLKKSGVDAAYTITEKDNGYEINIKIQGWETI